MRNSRKSGRCLDTDPTCATPKYVRIGTPFNGRVWALCVHRSPSKGVPLAVCLASLPRPGPAHRDLDVGGSWLGTTRAGEDRSPYSRVLHSGRCDALGQLRVPLTDGYAERACERSPLVLAHVMTDRIPQALHHVRARRVAGAPRSTPDR